MGFFEWLVEPIEEIMQQMRTPIIIEKDIIDPEISFPQYIPKGKLFRPQNFEQYLGQEKAKTILKDYINAMRERQEIMPHILIHGPAGTGKTTLARIIANELEVPFNELITSTIKSSFDLLFKIQMTKGGIIFLDEIHSIERSLGESIYTAMEDFLYNGQPIHPFTLAGATTELGELIETRSPFVDRFKIILELEDYGISELAMMSEQYKNAVFPNDKISKELYVIIAYNSRRTPRMVIRLTECLVYMKGDIRKVLHNFNIIQDGYTYKDLKTLNYIKDNQKGVGLEGLASYLGTSKKNYVSILEPYLLKTNLIVRTGRGRKITDQGIQKILELEKAIRS